MVASTASYQGGPFVEVFSSSGSNPLVNCKLTSEKGGQKVYEKAVKGYVYTLSGASSKLQVPKDDRKAPLRLLQQFLVLQVYVPAGQHFALELGVIDGAGSKRKLYFSTAFHEVKATPLHCQVPLTALERDAWLNLAFDLVDIFGACFKGVPYKSLDLLILGSVCHLRKIFTLRTQPIDSSDPSYAGELVPSSLDYPSGADFRTQVLNAARIKDSLAPGKRMSEDSGAPKAMQKRLSGSSHVAFGSRTTAPAPLVVVPANVDLSQREDSKVVKKSTPGPTGSRLSSQSGKAPPRGSSKQGSSAPSVADEDEDAGEEWSPTEHKKGAATEKKQAGSAAKTVGTGKQKGETLPAAKGKGNTIAQRSSERPVAPKKEVSKKAAIRAESPVAAWEEETPDESLLASMSSEWQRVTKDACAAEKLAESDAGLAEDREELQSSRSSSRASSRKERLSVHFGEENEALSEEESPASGRKGAQPLGYEASPGVAEEISEKTSTDARDVLAELEKELAELTAGTKNSPRAALWRSEVDGFSRSSMRKSKQDSIQEKASPERKARDSFASERLFAAEKDEEESKAIREEKLMAVSALEEWEGQKEEDGVNGSPLAEEGVNEQWRGEDAGVHEHWRGGEGGVNEHFEVHHEAASSASHDTWKSRRSNSRYSQESEDSDVTPRASRKEKEQDEKSFLGEETSRRSASHGSEREVEERLVDQDEQKRPNIDWDAEDDERSSLGSLEGSEWGARLSRERRTFRGSSARSNASSDKARKSSSRLANSVSRPSSKSSGKSNLELEREAHNSFPETEKGRKSRRTSALETSLSEWTAAADLSSGASGSGLTSRGSRERTSSSDVSRSVSQRSEERGPAHLDGPTPDRINAALRTSAVFESASGSGGASGVGLSASTRLEDMDLLFDPILKCFYDPTTNKYYELKDDEETSV